MAATENRLILDQCSIPGVHQFDVARKHGYYDTWEKVLRDMTPDNVIETVTASGLQGRGGAWFSTGMKWSFMPKEPDPERYSILAINCDESEPGTSKDRYMLETNPHMLIEGILISAYATRAKAAYIYIRGEMWEGLDIMDRAIRDVYEAGLAGENILGTGVTIHLHVHPGAGAYICGEETALMESTEGKRGYPRNKPPFPAAYGIFGHPTTINNIGTLGYVPWIVKNGAETFKAIGDPNFPGTLIYQISGHVNKPGLYETNLTVTLRELIELAGGVKNGNRLLGVIPGGTSMPMLTPDEIDVVMSPSSFMPRGEIKSGLGSAAVIVFDETADIVDIAHNMMTFYRHESCGQCTPCREGAKWVWDVVNRLAHRTARPGDVDMLEDILVNVGDIDRFETNKTICLFGVSFGWPMTMLVRKYRDHFQRAENESVATPLPRPTPLPIIAAGHLGR